MTLIKVPVRYFTMQSKKPEDVVESNIKYSETIWQINTSEAALVLVDIWNRHIIKTHMERVTDIVENKIRPVIENVRKAGITIIHGPSVHIAKKYPQWVNYAGDEELNPPKWQPPSWPPEDFRNRKAEYAQYSHPFYDEEISKYTKKYYREHMIADVVEPEPEDFVIATGKQLQRLLEHRKILHLFYAGFAANDCMIHKDYGVRAMGEKGYNVILLRDCTTAIEFSSTLSELLATKWAIQYTETRYSSTTSEELVNACRKTN